MLNEKELAQVSILKRYKGMDRNGDGKVSAEELALTMQKR
jgi:mono/diheme cytochrome c family protein